jgi:hypothetical protein
MIRALFRTNAAPSSGHARRQQHWARVHIAADRREPFQHVQPRKPDLVIGCRCGKTS